MEKTKKNKNVSNNLTIYKFGNTNVHILGTAHISQKSVDEVENSIEKTKHDCVALELCNSRYENITKIKNWQKMDILKVIQQKKGYVLAASLIISWYQRKMGDLVDVMPGEEFRMAIRSSNKKNVPIELVDRDVQITLKRAWQSIGFFNKMFIMSELVASLFYKIDIDKKTIEEMKNKDILENFLDNIPTKLNKIKKIIITERDVYIAQKIKDIVRKNPNYKNILLVVGAGHVKGIIQNLDNKKDISLEKICLIRKTSKVKSTLQFFTPIILIMTIFFYFSDNSNREEILQNIFIWIGVKSFCSGILALILLPHPLAVIGAILTSPISNFNPFLKPGWVSSIIQAYFKKPNVVDFENIYDDMKSIKKIYKNKLFRILGLLFLPQFGSSIGTLIALAWILQ